MRCRVLAFTAVALFLSAYVFLPAWAEDRVLVHVYLADGFTDDRVVARIEGREVFAKDDVTTNLLTSLGDEFAFEAKGAVRLDVELPGRGLATAIDIDPRRGRYVAVAVEAGRLTHFVSEAPLGFH